MSKKTSPDEYPYPEDADAPDGPSQIKVLAERIQALTPIRGSFTKTGVILSGSGFTVEKTATGRYTITLSKELATTGVMLVSTAESETFVEASVNSSGKKVFKVITYTDKGGALNDAAVNFIVYPS